MRFRTLTLILSLMILFQRCQAQLYSEKYADYKVYKSLKVALKNKSDVKILHLHNKGLEEFPREILEMKNLKVLSLYKNEINQLPDDIYQLQDLEILELRKNNLSSLPKAITELKNLKRLNVAYNSLSEKDVEFIEDALPNCTIITNIIL